MADTERSGAGGGTIMEELRQIIAFVEAATGLPSRWNGGLLILAEGTDEAWAAQALPRVSYLAKKEWNCSITVVESVLQDNRRWRTLLHESLHSVSVGLTEPDYQRFRLWEEAVVESLQRLYRPLLLQSLGLNLEEEQFQALETAWRYNSALNALGQIAAERPEVPFQDLLEALLRTPLSERSRLAFDWAVNPLTSAVSSAFTPLPVAFCGYKRRRVQNED